jgi:hypothetical protein
LTYTHGTRASIISVRLLAPSAQMVDSDICSTVSEFWDKTGGINGDNHTKSYTASNSIL